MLIFFFFKQKKAYWKRICDRSSDVCSSDLEDGNECLYPALGPGSGPQRKTHSSRSRVGFQIVAIVVLELLEIVVDLKLGVFLRIRVDRKSVVKGKSVSVRVAIDGRRILKNKHKTNSLHPHTPNNTKI